MVSVLWRAQLASAGQVNAVVTPPPSPSTFLLPPTPAPNNDDVVFSTNSRSFTLRFNQPDPIDVELSIVPSDGVTPYSLIGVANNSSGVNWSGFRVLLGNSTGLNFVQGAISDLDFDLPDRNSPRTMFGFDPSVHEAAEIRWDVQVISGNAPNFFFSVDVPDGPTNPYNFSMRFEPLLLVPEPSGLIALTTGAFLLLRRRAH